MLLERRVMRHALPFSFPEMFPKQLFHRRRIVKIDKPKTPRCSFLSSSCDMKTYIFLSFNSTSYPLNIFLSIVSPHSPHQINNSETHHLDTNRKIVIVLLHTQKQFISPPSRRQLRHPPRRSRQLRPLKLEHSIPSRTQIHIPIPLSSSSTNTNICHLPPQHRSPPLLLRILNLFPL